MKLRARLSLVLLAFATLLLLSGCADIPGIPKQAAKTNISYDFEGIIEIEDPNINMVDGAVLPEFERADLLFDGMMVEKGNVSAVYFYRPGCSACNAISPYLEQEIKKYGESLDWYEYDISTEEGWEKYTLFADAYGVPQNERYVPMFYAGGQYGWGIDAIRNNLTGIIDRCQKEGCYSPFELVRIG